MCVCVLINFKQHTSDYFLQMFCIYLLLRRGMGQPNDARTEEPVQDA